MSETELVSYCVECDALPGECEHKGPRYLDPIVYEKAEGGWKIPEHERARWENDRWRGDTKPEDVQEPPSPLTIEAIIERLTPYVLLSDRLCGLLYDAYENNPHQTTQAALDIERNYQRFDSPGGVLIKELKRIIGE